MDTSRVHSGVTSPGLPAGTLLGGRFEIALHLGAASLGETYRAVDKKNAKSIAIRVLPGSAFPTAADLERLRDGVKLAATLTHRNIVGTFGMGVEPSGVTFIASELVDGRPLRALLAERGALSLRSAYNVIAHACNALGYAHGKLIHAALAPASILVNRAGRVKVGDFGLLQTLHDRERHQLLGARNESMYLAPEVASGLGGAGPAADFYSLGVLLFELLAGRPPSLGERISAWRPDVPSAIDAWIARAASPSVTERFATAAELKAALYEALSDAAPPSPGLELDDVLDVEIDIEPTGQHGLTPMPTATVPPAIGKPAMPPPPPLGPIDLASGGTFFTSGPPSSSEPLDGRGSHVDLASLLNDLTAQDAERWMVQKDKLDHGPFTARELIQQIMRGQVLAGHVVVDMDTGDRKKLESWPEFKDFSEEYRVRKAKQDAQAALARAERVEKHGTAAKFLIVALVLAVIGAAVGLFFVTRQTVSETSQTPDELADLFAAGKIPVSGSAGILPLARGGAHRTGRRPDRPRSAGGALSYEDAMNQAVDLGNVESGGGEQQLTAQKVAAAMNANIRRFGACVGIDPSVRSVSMNLAITGNGSIVGVSVSQGSPAFRQCIGSRARSIRLPPFSAPRMGASFHFSW